MNFMCFIYGKQIWNPLYYRYYSIADFLLDGIIRKDISDPIRPVFREYIKMRKRTK